MTGVHSSTAESLGARLAQLPLLPREQLVELWEEHMGKPPPKAASSSLLMRAVAYAIQEQQLGGLKGAEIRILCRIGRSAGERAKTRRSGTAGKGEARSEAVAGHGTADAPDPLRDPLERTRPGVTSRPAIPTILKPGTRLVREWHGRNHTIDVRVDGFGWNGGVYRSLSAVARAITGTHCSGNRFFRL